MARNYYTDDEIVVCTYAATYDADDFGGVDAVCSLTGRSAASIPMKIRNIASMLDSKAIPRHSKISGLTGKTRGDGGRNTNWDVVEPLTLLSRQAFLLRCKQILK